MPILSPEFFALVIVAVVIAIERYTPILDKFKPKSAAQAAAELSIAEHANARLRAERDAARTDVLRLEETRSIEPVLNLIREVSESQRLTLDKLAAFNGALTRQEKSLDQARQGLEEATEGLRLVVGLLIGSTDVTPSAIARRETHAG